jgi:hypothetical protein
MGRLILCELLEIGDLRLFPCTILSFSGGTEKTHLNISQDAA